MLNGQTALIVEEEFLIALDIQRMLEAWGAGQTLFARTAAEAEELRSHWPEIGLAVVDIRSDDMPALSLAESLAAAGIPVVLATADAAVRQGLTLQLPVVIKPVPEDIMASAIRQALANSS